MTIAECQSLLHLKLYIINNLFCFFIHQDSETVLQMKKQVESWLHEKSGLEITFSADRALENLKNMSSKEEKGSEEQTVQLHN